MGKRDYITKDFALYVVHYFNSMLTWSKEDILGEIDHTIKEAKPEDVARVVHGRWIEKQEPIPWCEDDVDVFTVCSICNSRSIGESNYCPNFGAKMDLEVN